MPHYRTGAVGALLAVALWGSVAAAQCGERNPLPLPTLNGSTLTLDIALQRVRRASPESLQAALEASALEADADQGARRPNPELSFEVEDFAGSGALSGFSAVETTFGVSQTLELGGKRRARERAARARALTGEARCRATVQDAELRAALLFYRILAAREVAELAKQSAALSQTLSETVGKRVKAGAAAPPELLRAESDAARLKAAALRLEADHAALRYELAILWGSESPKFGALVIQPSTDGPSSGSVIANHPRLVAAQAGEDALRAERRLAETRRIPDVTVNIGVRRFEETGDAALLAGFSVPLPIFDKNRDAVRAATIRADAARISAVAVQTQLVADLNASRLHVEASRDRLALLETTALPAAQDAYAASVRGYEAGRFDLTTTLNARRDLLEAGVAVVSARLALNEATTELQSLTGSYPFLGDTP